MIAFPISPKEFIRYQEQLVGRALSEKEKEITADWAEIFNLVYEDGLSQDHTTLYEDLSLLDKIAACFRDEPGISVLIHRNRHQNGHIFKLSAPVTTQIDPIDKVE